MVEDSVDDMYFGCTEAIMKIYLKYFEHEKHVKPFEDAWNACARQQLKQREDKALTKHQIQAICAYTSDEIYEKFNNAVWTERRKYNSSFQFHSLHFLLTSAVQILNSKNNCHTAYRRTKVKFTGGVNQIIRFGSFASSSYKKNLTFFGNKTCFKIKTCSGAPLKNYSMFDDEEEVLIPPYEMFKITKIINGGFEIQGLDDCEVVYVLESAGLKSNLNCKVAHWRESSGSSPTSGNNHSAIFKPSHSLVTTDLIR